MRDLIKAEWRKAFTGRVWWISLLAGVFLTLLSTFGLASQGKEEIAAGTTDLATLTDGLARNAFAILLFVGILCAVLVAREYASGSISRSVVVAGRSRLFSAKLVAATGIGAVFGAVAVVVGFAGTWAIMTPYGLTPEFSATTVATLAGVFAVNVLAAPWGAALGWILRSPVVAVSVVLALALLVEPGIQALAPSVGQFFLTIAMSSVYGDVKPVLLSIPVAAAVIAGWLLALSLVARKQLQTQDISS